MSRSVYDFSDGSEGVETFYFYDWRDSVSGVFGEPDPAWPYEAGQRSGAEFRLEQLARREARTLQAVEVLMGMTRADIARAELDLIPF